MDGLFARSKTRCRKPDLRLLFGFAIGQKPAQVLSFDSSGLTLFIKRLERSTFRW